MWVCSASHLEDVRLWVWLWTVLQWVALAVLRGWSGGVGLGWDGWCNELALGGEARGVASECALGGEVGGLGRVICGRRTKRCYP